MSDSRLIPPHLFFHCEEFYLVFVLLYMDAGERRNQMLGLTEEHFHDVNKANQWLQRTNRTVTNASALGMGVQQLAKEEATRMYRLLTYIEDAV